MSTQINNNSSSPRFTSVGLLGLTFILLLVMKLGGWANISWFIVFLPMFLGIGFFALIVILLVVLAVLSDKL